MSASRWFLRFSGRTWPFQSFQRLFLTRSFAQATRRCGRGFQPVDHGGRCDDFRAACRMATLAPSMVSVPLPAASHHPGEESHGGGQYSDERSDQKSRRGQSRCRQDFQCDELGDGGQDGEHGAGGGVRHGGTGVSDLPQPRRAEPSRCSHGPSALLGGWPHCGETPQSRMAVGPRSRGGESRFSSTKVGDGISRRGIRNRRATNPKVSLGCTRAGSRCCLVIPGAPGRGN